MGAGYYRFQCCFYGRMSRRPVQSSQDFFGPAKTEKVKPDSQGQFPTSTSTVHNCRGLFGMKVFGCRCRNLVMWLNILTEGGTVSSCWLIEQICNSRVLEMYARRSFLRSEELMQAFCSFHSNVALALSGWGGVRISKLWIR